MKNKVVLNVLVAVFSLLLWQCRAKKPLITDSSTQELLSKQKADTIVSQVLANNFEFTDLKAQPSDASLACARRNLAASSNLAVAAAEIGKAFWADDTDKLDRTAMNQMMVGGKPKVEVPLAHIFGDRSVIITRKVEGDAKVIVNKGPAFGAGGEAFLRFNFACTRATLDRAIDQLADAFARV